MSRTPSASRTVAQWAVTFGALATLLGVAVLLNGATSSQNLTSASEETGFVPDPIRWIYSHYSLFGAAELLAGIVLLILGSGVARGSRLAADLLVVYVWIAALSVIVASAMAGVVALVAAKGDSLFVLFAALLPAAGLLVVIGLLPRVSGAIRAARDGSPGDRTQGVPAQTSFPYSREGRPPQADRKAIKHLRWFKRSVLAGLVLSLLVIVFSPLLGTVLDSWGAWAWLAIGTLLYFLTWIWALGGIAHLAALSEDRRERWQRRLFLGGPIAVWVFALQSVGTEDAE